MTLQTLPSREIAFLVGPLTTPEDCWADTVARDRGLVHGANFPAEPPFYDPHDPATVGPYDAYVNRNYYDQAAVQYQNYFRTGDSRYLEYARKVADSWWQCAQIGEGKVDPSASFAPRSVGLLGLMLRALDDRPEMWPWIVSYVREHFFGWCERPANWTKPLSDAVLAGTEAEAGKEAKAHGFYFGVRDGGYMLLHAANLAAVHPDKAVRDEFAPRVLDVALNYYGRLQRVQGTGGFGFYLDGMEGLTTQPFQVGLLAEGLVAVHRLTNDSRVADIITRSAEHQYARCFNPVGWKAMYYFVGGQFADGTRCETGCGAAATPFPPADVNMIAEARHLNPTTIHHFGYAYLLTGDVRFKGWGRELYGATFKELDEYGGLPWAREKEYDETYRSVFKFKAYVEHRETGTALPLPPYGVVTVADVPAPPPVTGGGTATPTFFVGGRVTKGGVAVPGLKVNLYDSGGVDAMGSAVTDSAGVYRFEVNPNQRGVVRPEGSGFSPLAHSFTATATVSDFDFAAAGVPVPEPVPQPVPVPTPTPLPTPTLPEKQKVAWPKQEGKWEAIADEWAAKGYRFKRPLTGDYAEFVRMK